VEGQSVTRSRKLEWLARSGLVARGVIYAVIGVLAIKLALGDGGRATDQQGALHTIAGQPFGKVLLAIVAVGLLGYVSWQLIRAAVGHGRETNKDDAKERISAAVGGVGYGILLVAAVRILAGSGSGGGGSGSARHATGGVLGWPAGTWLVGIAGAILIGAGIEQGYTGVRRKFLEQSKTEKMGERVEPAFSAVGVFGHLARMVVFALIGYFLVRAAIDYDPHKAVALDGALAKLGQASYGPVLLGVVAAGLIGFAVFSVLEAVYRRV
jgi:hypothetical protein